MIKPENTINFKNVVSWLVNKNYPRDEAVRLCQSDLRNGLRALNKMKAYDKELAKRRQGQQPLFKWK